jgi:hypothetical protein
MGVLAIIGNDTGPPPQRVFFPFIIAGLLLAGVVIAFVVLAVKRKRAERRRGFPVDLHRP